MKIAALLPHVEVFGGVRRYLELGNELTRRGHRFTLFTPLGEAPDWLRFEGTVKPFSSLEEEIFDAGLVSEYSILPHFERLKAQAKFFYFVLEGHKKEREVIRKNFRFLGNSEGICRRLERRYGISCDRVPGGVNFETFYPLERKSPRKELRILCYGRIYKKRKGVRQVIRAVELLSRRFPQLRLVFFDSSVGGEWRDPRALIKASVPYEFYFNLPQNKMAWLFAQADIFCSAERRAGWANTAAEAMACRLPVVCTKSGTMDFAIHGQTALVAPSPHPFFLSRQLRRLVEDEPLRFHLAQAGYEKIRRFSWAAAAARLEKAIQARVN